MVGRTRGFLRVACGARVAGYRARCGRYECAAAESGWPACSRKRARSTMTRVSLRYEAALRIAHRGPISCAAPQDEGAAVIESDVAQRTLTAALRDGGDFAEIFGEDRRSSS